MAQFIFNVPNLYYNVFQMTVRAVSRLRSAFATVRILITQVTNQMPFFLNTPYRASIFSSRVVNDTIISVSARDNDLVVSLKTENLRA